MNQLVSLGKGVGVVLKGLSQYGAYSTTAAFKRKIVDDINNQKRTNVFILI